MNALDRIINFCKSDRGPALAILLSLTVMIFHTAATFYTVSIPDTAIGWIKTAGILGMSIVFAISVDLAVLIFALRGRKVISWLFSAFQIVVNVSHFQQMNDGSALQWVQVFISFALPVAIAIFSHEIKEAKESESGTFPGTSLMGGVTPLLEKDRAEIEALRDDLSERISKVDGQYHSLERTFASLGDNWSHELEKQERTNGIFRKSQNQTIVSLLNLKRAFPQQYQDLIILDESQYV